MGGGEKEYKLPTQVRLQFPTTVHNWAETQCPKTGLVRQFYLVNLPFFSTAQQQGKPTLCQTAIISHVAVTSSALLSCLYSIFYTKGSILQTGPRVLLSVTPCQPLCWGLYIAPQHWDLPPSTVSHSRAGQATNFFCQSQEGFPEEMASEGRGKEQWKSSASTGSPKSGFRSTGQGRQPGAPLCELFITRCIWDECCLCMNREYRCHPLVLWKCTTWLQFRHINDTLRPF